MLNLLALMMVTGSARAQFADYRNAASRYQRAFDMYQRQARFVNDRHSEALNEFGGAWGRGPSPEARHAMTRYQPAIVIMQSAARQKMYDQPLSVAHGFYDTPPHLTQMRTLVRMTRLDFLQRLNAGDATAAADRITCVLRASKHLSDDNFVLSTRVATAIFALADTMIDELADAGLLDAARARTLMQHVSEFSGHDPFNGAGGIEGVRQLTTQWLAENYTGEGGLELLVEDYEIVGEDLPFELDPEMQQEEFDVLVTAVDVFLERAASAFAVDDEDDRAALIELLDTQAESLDFGFLSDAMPHLGSLERANARALKTVRDRLAMLNDVIERDADPRLLANAAVLYMRAARMLRQTAREFDLIGQYAARFDEPASEKLIMTLADASVQSIIDDVAFAANLQRCDFDVCRYDVLLFDACQRDMRELVDLLTADAARLLNDRKIDAAVDRLEILFGMLKHMADDGTIGSALSVDLALHRATRLIAMVSHHLTDQQRATMLKRFSFANEGDPFGYRAGLILARKELFQWFAISGPHELQADGWVERYPLDGEALQHVDRVDEFMSRLPEQRVPDLFVMLNRELLQWRSRAARPEQFAQGLEPLIDSEALTQVYDAALGSFSRLQSSKFESGLEFLPERSIIPNLESRLKAAFEFRRNLQRALELNQHQPPTTNH